MVSLPGKNASANALLDAARELRARGLGIVWLVPGEKNPMRTGWTFASQEPQDYQPGFNLGLMTGRISADLVCADLDSELALAKADEYLPPTSMIEGRKSKPRSHRYYKVVNIPLSLTSDCPSARHLGGGPKIVHFSRPAKIDFLGTGAHAVVPPSRHASGELREWENGVIGEPALVDCQVLFDAVYRLAEASGWKRPKPSHDEQQHGYQPDRLKRAIAYLEKVPGGVQGENGSGPTFSAARALCWGFCLDQATALGLLLAHFNPRCSPPWSIGELEHKVKDGDERPFTKPRGWLLDEGHPRAARTNNGAHENNGVPRDAPADGKAPEFRVGDLEIKPGAARQTDGGKLVLPLTINQSGTAVDCVPLSSSPSGRKAAQQIIARYLPDENKAQAEHLVQELIVYGLRLVMLQEVDREGATIRDIIGEKVKADFPLVYRTEKGLAWCEARGTEISRADFLSFTPEHIVNAASAASDAPRDVFGRVDRPRLLRAIKAELEILWTDLFAALPAYTAASDLGPNTEAARRFWSAMVRVWTAPQTFEVAKTVAGTSGETVAARASLVSRVQAQAKPYLTHQVAPSKREAWRPVQSAFAAWWRPRERVGVDGEVTVCLYLAMRWTLPDQLRLPLPGVQSQKALTVLGERFGVIDASPPVSRTLSGGAETLAVLSRALTEELLAIPAPDSPETSEESTP